MDDEVAFLEDVFRSAGDRFHLVGHSYGGAIALKAALARAGRVASLAIFEPVLFSILLAEDPEQPAAREILSVGDDTTAAMDAGDPTRAARRFIDYWMGAGAWATTPEKRREPIAAGMRKVKDEWRAIFNDRTTLTKLGELLVPTLLMTGTESPAASRGVVRLLRSVLPGVTTVEVAGVGHMAPITHPDKINALIEEHLERYA
jgi:pimeloyl-ACP methyl ester carboxylesterase